MKVVLSTCREGTPKLSLNCAMSALQCPNSALACFPKEIYQSVGSSSVLPQLLDVIDVENLLSAQFLRDGFVRLTFTSADCCDEFLKQDLKFGEISVPVISASTKLVSVYLRDLPFEVSDDAVKEFFGSYGDVFLVSASKYKDYPNLCDGTRIIKMSLSSSIPYFVDVTGFPCRVWYPRQPTQCVICREVGHRGSSCPFLWSLPALQTARSYGQWM